MLSAIAFVSSATESPDQPSEQFVEPNFLGNWARPAAGISAGVGNRAALGTLLRSSQDSVYSSQDSESVISVGGFLEFMFPGAAKQKLRAEAAFMGASLNPSDATKAAHPGARFEENAKVFSLAISSQWPIQALTDNDVVWAGGGLQLSDVLSTSIGPGTSAAIGNLSGTAGFLPFGSIGFDHGLDSFNSFGVEARWSPFTLDSLVATFKTAL